MKSIVVFVIAVFTALGTAHAQSGEGIDVNAVREIARQYCDRSNTGLPCDVQVDDRAYQFNANGKRYLIIFRQCKSAQRCDRLSGYLGFVGADGVTRSQFMQFTNQWNNRYFSQAYVDSEDDPVVQDWIYTPSGISDEQIFDFFSSWQQTIVSFSNQLRDWTPARTNSISYTEASARKISRRGETFMVHDAAQALNANALSELQSPLVEYVGGNFVGLDVKRTLPTRMKN